MIYLAKGLVNHGLRSVRQLWERKPTYPKIGFLSGSSRHSPALPAVEMSWLTNGLSMALGFFLQGLLIGFSIAAPVGPIGLLCIRRTLAEGILLGFICGLGAATADAIYGVIAGMGLTFVSNVLMTHRDWLRLVGGVFLCYLGLKIILSRPRYVKASVDGVSFARAFASTFFLTLTNPLTIMSFMAIFAGLGVGNNGSYLFAGYLVLGVFLGSALWWLMLSAGVGLIRSTLNEKALIWINRIAGIGILGFGIFATLNAGK